MSKNTCWKITPVNGYDLPGLENWLSQMAARGWRFSSTIGPLTCFTKAEPETLQVHLEPIQRQTTEADPDLNALYEEAGWTYLGVFRGSCYVYATPDLEAKAHTDPEVLDYVLKRFARRKLASGLLLLFGNLMLLGIFVTRYHWSLVDFRYFPAETFANRPVIPALLTIIGLFLVDLSYLLGLFHLWRHRRAIKTGKTTHPSRSGPLLVIGILILLPVFVELSSYFFGLDYSPIDLEGSGFVTLAEIEGEGFRPTGDYMYNMDYISHSDTLLTAENWYWRQYATHPQNFSSSDINHLELQITRYLLPQLASQRAKEWSYYVTYGDYETPSPVYGLDQIMIAQGENHKGNHGAYLILRMGNTVLRADYVGDQDLPDFLPRFAEMMEGL